jgi:hypothetical protein
MFRKAKTIFEEIKLKQHDEDFEPDELPEPTGARPGSLEKLFVIVERVEKGQQLFHPGDEMRSATISQQFEKTEFINKLFREALEARQHARRRRK